MEVLLMGFINQVTRFDYQEYNLRNEKSPNKQDLIPVNHTWPVYLQTYNEDTNQERENDQPRKKYIQHVNKKQHMYSEKTEQLIAELSGKGQYFREYV